MRVATGRHRLPNALACLKELLLVCEAVSNSEALTDDALFTNWHCNHFLKNACFSSPDVSSEARIRGHIPRVGIIRSMSRGRCLVRGVYHVGSVLFHTCYHRSSRHAIVLKSTVRFAKNCCIVRKI